ncbi:MAG: hypothetical protein LBB52_06030, partial [Desulfovibrio sp.]|nr:hypothetical protein [Desulfovibrio sp.]
MADPQNVNEDVIELTELIEKGDCATAAGSETVSKSVPKAKENATGTALENLNDASAASPEGDIDFLLAQMDADDKNEMTAQSANQAEISTDLPTADETGHIVDPHEKLDMSGMKEVDNLLSSLQIPLTPIPAEAGEEDFSLENAVAAQNAAPPPQANIPFDLDSLLNPGADVNAPSEDTDTRDDEEPKVEPPGAIPSQTCSAADTQLPENKQTEPRELSAELDDILAAAGDPDLPEDFSPRQPPEKGEAPAAAEELPENQLPAKAPTSDPPARTQEIQPDAELAGPAEKSLDSDWWPPVDDAIAEQALPVDKNSAPSQTPAECMPEIIQDAQQNP